MKASIEALKQSLLNRCRANSLPSLQGEGFNRGIETSSLRSAASAASCETSYKVKASIEALKHFSIIFSSFVSFSGYKVKASIEALKQFTECLTNWYQFCYKVKASIEALKHSSLGPFRRGSFQSRYKVKASIEALKHCSANRSVSS